MVLEEHIVLVRGATDTPEDLDPYPQLVVRKLGEDEGHWCGPTSHFMNSLT